MSPQRVTMLLWTKPNRRKAARPILGTMSAILRAGPPRGRASSVVDFLSGRFFIDCIMRSEEHTSELQSLMRISYAVFCLKKKKRSIKTHTHHLSLQIYKERIS